METKLKSGYLKLMMIVVGIGLLLMYRVSMIYSDNQNGALEVPRINGCVYIQEVWVDFNDMNSIAEVSKSVGVDVNFEVMQLEVGRDNSIVWDIVRGRNEDINLFMGNFGIEMNNK